MKHMRKTIALFLAVLMTLSVFSVVGFAEGDTDPATAGPFTVKFLECAPENGSAPKVIWEVNNVEKGSNVPDPYENVKNQLKYPAELDKDFYKWEFTGWSHSLENVQSNLTISPRYNKVGKQYNVIYHNFDGSKISPALSYVLPVIVGVLFCKILEQGNTIVNGADRAQYVFCISTYWQ